MAAVAGSVVTSATSRVSLGMMGSFLPFAAILLNVS
jgi:hypothetical protein